MERLYIKKKGSAKGMRIPEIDFRIRHRSIEHREKAQTWKLKCLEGVAELVEDVEASNGGFVPLRHLEKIFEGFESSHLKEVQREMRREREREGVDSGRERGARRGREDEWDGRKLIGK